MEKKKISVKNKKIIILIVLFLIFVALIPMGFSLFTDEKVEGGDINVSKIEVVLKEDPEWEENEDEYGIKKYSKKIKGVSVAELDAYVRIRCIPIVQYYDEDTSEWITASVAQDDIMLVMNSDDWQQNGDFWYYKKVLKGHEETEVLNIDWRILEIPSQISTKKMRTDVRIVLEYAQASNEMWKEIFGISELPSEVEHYQE